PVLAVVSDSDRRVFQVVDWVGGEGSKPATGDYVGVSGLVSDIGDAVDVRGAAGLGGVSSVNEVEPDGGGNVELDAGDIPYDNTSGMAATTVQDAIEDYNAEPHQ